MAVELFLIPMVQFGLNRFGQPHYDPKYVGQNTNVVGYGVIRYSRVSEALVLVQAPSAELTSIRGNTEVMSIATVSNIDNQINVSQRNGIRAYLEAREVPAQWVNTGDTRRELIRGLAGIYLFAQRVEARTGTGLKESFRQAGITLEDTWLSLPQGAKNILLETAESFGWETPGFTNTVTVREILKFFSSQFESEPITMAGFNI